MKIDTQKGDRVKRCHSSGFSLVEVVIAMSVLAVAFFGMISVITYTTRNNQTTKERILAMRAAEKMVETMLSKPFSSIYSLYGNPLKDPSNPANLDNYAYPVEGLQPWAGNAYVMYIYFPTDNWANNYDPKVFVNPVSAVGGKLLESKTAKFMELTDSAGVPVSLDLNQNGIAPDTIASLDDCTATYKLLPVKIEVNYIGMAGRGQLIYRHIFLSK